MTAQESALLRSLADREAIRECLYRYCRGIDRLDAESLRSAYWPDGTDRHGAYNGSAQGFVDWALDKLPGAGRMIHTLGNILIELRGDVAAVESYFQAWQADRDAQGQPQETFLCGRYVDRFERRGAEWRVAARTVVYDWLRQTPLPPGTDLERFGVRQPMGGRKPDDALYELLSQPPFATTP